MAGIDHYPGFVEKLIRQYGQYKPAYGDVETQMIFDKVNHHYLLMSVGWDGNERIRGCVLHIDVKDGKIWIQHDGTEIGVANELVDMGVPKQDIVLAFHAPYKRRYTEFGR